jgi:hypothetical protein
MARTFEYAAGELAPLDVSQFLQLLPTAEEDVSFGYVGATVDDAWLPPLDAWGLEAGSWLICEPVWMPALYVYPQPELADEAEVMGYLHGVEHLALPPAEDADGLQTPEELFHREYSFQQFHSACSTI